MRYFKTVQGEIHSFQTRMVRPRCVRCGHLRSVCVNELALPQHCEQCGCDLEDRPPMSYAAMEGFQEVPPEPACNVESWHQALETRLVERWVATVFLGLLISILVLSLLYS